MDELLEGRLRWARMLGLLASAFAGIILVGVLALGVLALTLDWDALSCFDGGEPACADSAANAGLGAVQATSWLIAVAACAAVVVSAVMSWRMRRPAQLVPVLALCAGVFAAAVGLTHRF